MVNKTWQNETDWLVALVHFQGEDPGEDANQAETLGHLLAYADITNTRSLALVGDPEAGVYEVLFSFDSSQNKDQFLKLVAAIEDLGQEFIGLMGVPSASEIERAEPLAAVIPPKALLHANVVEQLILEELARKGRPVN